MNSLPRNADRFATRDDLAALGEMRAEVAVVRGELRTEISSRNRDLLRTLFFAMVASNATLVGLVFAAVRLG